MGLPEGNPLRGRKREKLVNRHSERRVLDQLISAVRAGESRVIVLLGEPGVGKTALLDYVSERAAGCQIARVAGVESEMELAFSGLHQLCAPMLDQLPTLPPPQRGALGTAFGVSSGPPPDRFLIGLGVLALLSEAAGQRPLVCLIDDQQWLDAASAKVLGFVARRLAADAVGLVFAALVPGDDLAGLPQLPLGGLRDADAQTLLESALIGTLDSRAKELIIAESQGNPLALLELPRGLTSEQLAGGFGLPGTVPLTGRIEESFRRQVAALPPQSRRLLQLAAAEPTGSPFLVRRAAARLGIPAGSEEPAVEAGLVRFRTRVRFRHPLLRYAAYHSASGLERRAIHAALALVSDPAADPDRLAWHRAAAAAGPDEAVAAELEHSAARAQARGGLSAAAAFLERAALLTPEPVPRVTRAIAAAEAKHQAGAPEAAADLLATAEAGPLDELARARISLIRGRMAFSAGHSGDTPRLLLDAARRFEALDGRLARDTYLEALSAALLGHRAGPEGLLEVARAARGTGAAPPDAPAHDLLLDGMATLIADGYDAGVPAVRRAISMFRHGDLPVDEQLRWLFVATRCATGTWDDEGWRDLSTRQVEAARSAGALSLLPFALTQKIGLHMHSGEFTTAASLAREVAAIKEATATGIPDFGGMLLAAWQGRTREAIRLIDEVVGDMSERGRGFGASIGHYSAAALYNGTGQYDDAMARAQLASDLPEDSSYANLALVELIEAAALSGQRERAAAALERLAEQTRPAGTAWGLGVEARSRALLSAGDAAERLYLVAIDHLAAAPAGAELARAHLLYGEWLRREGRLDQARERLRIAQRMLDAIGMGGFADRARHELLAASGHPRARAASPAKPPAAGEALTEQEAQVASMARDGLSNPEIGTRLFISARTVQYHLAKVFTKLGISSRNELQRVLPAERDPVSAP
jgi:DNA-binding CsgD family transcriptional regulator/tetratricopeptide (TPR) repeat protein